MARLEQKDIKDELIHSQVGPDILEECDEWLDYFCGIIGGADEEGKPRYTIDDVPDPVPYPVKQLLIAWVCVEICVRKAGSATGKNYRNQENKAADFYVDKLTYWSSKFQSCKSKMTAEVLFGVSIPESTQMSFSIERG